MKNIVRHVLALSGGKDSSALAVYMRTKDIDMEYVFCDTEKELDETYDYLINLEAYLGKKIHYLKYSDGYGFDDILDIKNGFLPSPSSRWCTDYLKLRPYEEYLGDDEVISYVGIRADEAHRKGYVSSKPNIKTVFPFIEDNIDLAGVNKILNESGLGFPEYYNWRSRSGCYFCFFQQKREWLGLYQNHPDLFEKAAAYEKIGESPQDTFTWNMGESLYDLIKPERAKQIIEEYEKRIQSDKTRFVAKQKLINIFEDDENEEDVGDRPKIRRL
jgi:3'-phosphoadenosine 5'-phosphosulfate sulfotransferase (PAPS reductase)/FAD synthetase